MEDDDQQPSTSWAKQLGNLPAHPKNGLMKTYPNSQRTFQRPYSAKTVFFYKEGDVYFTGVRIPVSKHRYKTFESLVEELNHQIYMPFGVRNITTPMGRNTIDSLDQLEHLGKYVASSSKPPRGLDFGVVEKVQAALRSAQRSTASTTWAPGSPTIPQKMRMSRLLGITIPSKEVRFVLNGKGQFYRTMISPIKPPTMDQLLEEISSKLGVAIFRLHTDDGHRIMTVDEILTGNSSTVIACPRNERPFLKSTVKLPEIKPSRYAPRMAYSKMDSDTSSTFQSGASTSSLNGIEKSSRTMIRHVKPRPLPRVAQLATNKKPISLTGQKGGSNYWTHKYINNNNNSNSNSSSEKSEKKTKTKNVEDVDSGTGNSISSSWHTSEASESSRAESMTERKAQMIREEHQTSREASEEDLILEEEDEYHGGISSESSKTSSKEEERIETARTETRDSSRELHETRASTRAVQTPDTSSREVHGTSRDVKTASSLPRELQNSSPRELQTGASRRAVQTPDTSSRELHETRASSGVVQTPDTSPRELQNSSPRELHEATPAASPRPSTGLKTPNVQTPSRGNSEHSNRSSSSKGYRSPAVQTPDSGKGSRESTPTQQQQQQSARSDKEEILPSDNEEEHQEDLEKAATKIQAAFRGFKARQNRVKFEEEPKIEEKDEKEVEVEETVILESSHHEEQIEPNQLADGDINYTIEIKIGHRFGAETEANMYITMFGDEGQTDQIFLPASHDWLRSETRDSTDSPVAPLLFHVACKNLGVLNKITLGVDRTGYNAGTFIQEVIVTEDLLTGRRFLFFINKWFDGGQVDGKTERSAFLSTFLYLSSSPIRRNARTLGRFEFTFHTTKDELGGTTSNIRMIAVGEAGTKSIFVENDKMFREYQHNPLVQLDFGESIGQLWKLRIEIDGNGDRPNYFIDFVEIRDLDTDEKSVATIQKWLMIEGDSQNKKYQPFREIPIYRLTSDPVRSTTFEGKITLADTTLCTEHSPIIDLQFVGTDGRKSGTFPAVPVKLTNGKVGHAFKVDMIWNVSITEVLILPKLTEFGKDVMVGMAVLQQIYEKHELAVPVAHDLHIREISVRETNHAPYRQFFATSAVRIAEEIEEEIEELEKKTKVEEEEKTTDNNDNETFVKALTLSRIEGLPTTKKPTSKDVEPQTMHFVLNMSIEEPDHFEVPQIVLMPKNGQTYEMTPSSSTDSIMNYELKIDENIGVIEKIRIGIGELEAGKSTIINKIRLIEMVSGTETRFIFFSELREFEVLEMTCTYPDIAPKYSVIYSIQLTTIKSKGSFRPYINLNGADGDTGYRGYPGLTEFPEDTNVQMEVESLRLGPLKSINVTAKGEGKINWKFSIKVEFHDYGTTTHYTSDVLTIKKPDQIITADLALSSDDNDFTD